LPMVGASNQKRCTWRVTGWSTLGGGGLGVLAGGGWVMAAAQRARLLRVRSSHTRTLRDQAIHTERHTGSSDETSSSGGRQAGGGCKTRVAPRAAPAAAPPSPCPPPGSSRRT
jgi:hypothetical protein